jgi:choline-sulfatase
VKGRLLATCVAALASCSPTDEGAQIRNVVLITLDTTRADALGGYGRTPSVTPMLDALASESVLYTQAHTVAPLTLPAHASMLTGLVPLRHSVRDNGTSALPSDALSVAEMARDEDVDTAAFVSSSVLHASFGLDQGFALYDAPTAGERGQSSFAERSAADTARAAIRWLRTRDAEKRFLLWVHVFDPHSPYAAPESFAQAAGGDAYLGEVAFVDHAVGELLAALRAEGVLDRTLVVVVADHGESLGEHGEPTHGAYCYEATLRVPLLVRYPEAVGERRDDPASVVDVAPTIVEALELGALPEVDGLSLFRRRVPADRGAYFECYSTYLDYGWSQLAGWVDANGKYIASSAPELYDLDQDARELRNLLPGRETERAAFERRIAEIAARPALAPDTERTIDGDLARELQALGYAGAGAVSDELPGPLARLDRPSPADRSAELHSLLQATALLDARAFDEAIALLQTIARANPHNALALDQLGFALLQRERYDEARAALLQRLTLPTRRPETFVNLALCAERLGEREPALAYARAALELAPKEREALAVLERLGGGKSVR